MHSFHSASHRRRPSTVPDHGQQSCGGMGTVWGNLAIRFLKLYGRLKLGGNHKASGACGGIAAMRCGVRTARRCGLRPLPTISRRRKPFLTPPSPPPPRRLTAARTTAPRRSAWGAGPPPGGGAIAASRAHTSRRAFARPDRRLAEFPPPGNASPCAPPACRPGHCRAAWCVQSHLAKQAVSTGGQFLPAPALAASGCLSCRRFTDFWSSADRGYDCSTYRRLRWGASYDRAQQQGVSSTDARAGRPKPRPGARCAAR